MGCKCGPQMRTRFSYTAIFVVSLAFAVVLRIFNPTIFQKITTIALPDCANCLQNYLVFRVCAVLTIFYTVHAILLLGHTSKEKTCQHYINNRGWPVKVIAVIGLFFLFLFVPNGVFFVYGHVARIVSVFYVLIQLAYLVLFGYYWNRSWMDYRENIFCVGGDPPWMKSLLAVSIAMYLGALALLVGMIVFFGTSDGCWVNILIAVVAFLILVALAIVSIRAEHGSIVVSSLISLYIAFNLFSALTSQPNTCNTLFDPAGTGGGEPVIGALGILFTIVMIVYSAMRTGSKDPEDPFDEANDDGADEGDLSYSPSYFHMILAMAACYVAMVLVNWENGDTEDLLAQTWASFWVKLVISVLCIVVYAWTLIAPTVCPDRDFDFT